MQEILEKSKQLPEEEPENKTPAKPPLILVPRPEQEKKEIYPNYLTARDADLFKPGTVFEACKTKALAYPRFVVIEFDADELDANKDKMTVRRHIYGQSQFEQANIILKPSDWLHYCNFKHLDMIDIKKQDWDKQEYDPPSN